MMDGKARVFSPVCRGCVKYDTRGGALPTRNSNYSHAMIVIGTRFYDARGDAGLRQQRAREALLRLEDAVCVNLQFVDERHEVAGIRTVPLLRRDSHTVTRAAGARKPIVSEMFDALAEIARETGSRYFVYLNADIEVTREAVGCVGDGERTGYAFCRVEVDPVTHRSLGIQPYGIDMFAIDVKWWSRERRRFRPYIAGEMCWDNVYAALICLYGNGDVVDNRELIFHRRHASGWADDHAFAQYNGFLAALDAPYFSRWVNYVERVKADGSHAARDHDRIVRETLARPIAPAEGAVHALRQLRARVQYFIRRRAARSTSASDGRNASSSGGE